MAELNSKSSNILDNHINHSCAKKSERKKNEKKMKSRGKEKKNEYL